VQQIIGAKADLVAGQTQDARIAGSEHFDFRSPAKPEFLKLMYVVWLAHDLANPCAPSGRKLPQ
jgi:hypothetical protein